jgi:hypothetical protein
MMGDIINVKNKVIAKRMNIFVNTPLCSNNPFKLPILTVLFTKKLLLFFNNRSSFV